jgi:hypothetical protein
LAGLVAKRAEITGRIEALQVELRELSLALESLDNTIRLFDANYPVESIRPKPVAPIYKAVPGGTLRMVLSMIREAGRPISTRTIVTHVMAAHGITDPDRRTALLFRQRVGSLLRHYRTKGLLRSIKSDDGSFLVWEIDAQSDR